MNSESARKGVTGKLALSLVSYISLHFVYDQQMCLLTTNVSNTPLQLLNVYT